MSIIDRQKNILDNESYIECTLLTVHILGISNHHYD